MIMKFKCAMMPNGTVGKTKFKDGFAEIDSADSNEINELMHSPFIECLSDGIGNVNYGTPVPYGTMKNRLIRMTKPEVVDFAENVGVPCGDKSLAKDFFIDKILAIKYPEEHKDKEV